MSRTTLKSEATARDIRKVPFVRTAVRVAVIAAILGVGGLSLTKALAQPDAQVGGPVDKRIEGTGPQRGSGRIELHNQAGPDSGMQPRSMPANEADPRTKLHNSAGGPVDVKHSPLQTSGSAGSHEETTTQHDDEAKTDPAHNAEEEKHSDGADDAASTHAQSGHAEGKHKEAPFSIHMPTWISGALKQFFWHRGPATVALKGAVTADGHKVENLVGQTITFEYEDPHHPGHAETVTAKVTEVGGNTESDETATAQVNGQTVTLVTPEVSWQLEKMFPEAIIISWLTALGIIIVMLWMVRDLQKIPSKKQALAETLYEAFDYFVKNLIGPTYKKYVPLIVAAFIYVFCMNFVGLIPGWASPTANINVTAGMAIVVMVYVQYEGIRANGFVGYLKHFVGEPVWLFPLNFPLHIIGEFAKLLSLTIRLFGNIFGEDVVIVILLFLAVKFTQGLVPVHVLMYFFGIFTSFVQAMVFSILTCVYIAMMTVHDDHGSSHGHEQNDHNHGHGHEVAHAH